MLPFFWSKDLPLHSVTEFQLMLSRLVIMQVSPSVCRFENEKYREYLWSGHSEPTLFWISQKACEEKVTEEPDTPLHGGVDPQGELLSYQHLLVFIKYFSTCWSNTYSVKDCHGISSRNFGKRYDSFVYSETIFWVISDCVEAGGIWGWECLVCTFSLEMRWDTAEETPKSAWVAGEVS